MIRSRNPIGFTPLPVTFFILVIYICLFTSLLRVHHVLPSAPGAAIPADWPGVNLTDSWSDLQRITKQRHPYESKANDDLRAFLLTRIEDILHRNEIEFETTKLGQHRNSNASADGEKHYSRRVTVFDNDNSNVLFVENWRPPTYPVYFESNNIVVYIRGVKDDPSDWWTNGIYKGPGGVMVSAHYDSVASSLGATDNGMGVSSLLQVIAHFTATGQQPDRGILALFNNGEELGLYGASAFVQTPLAHFAHVFVNVEGVGAGGRAALFRGTDEQVIKHYAGSKHPFGMVLSQDAFKRRIIGSETDYKVFATERGMRGLDIAFIAPRSRYHTKEDSTRNTNLDSLWHMLDAVLTTVTSLSSGDGHEFAGSGQGGRKRVDAGSGDTAVWFDLFGRAFAIIRLHSLFAIAITLLVVGPVFLLGLGLTLSRLDKYYPFSNTVHVENDEGHDVAVKLYGGRGFFRFPLTIALSTAVVVALSLLITKLNPFMLYSSPYVVWAMMLSAWTWCAWFSLRLSDAVRPTALARFYSLGWLYCITWAILVATAVLMDQEELGGGYMFVFHHASVFVAFVIAHLELFALPRKSAFAEAEVEEGDVGALSPQDPADDGDTRRLSGDDADERTSLLGSRQTFVRQGRDRRRASEGGNEDGQTHHNQAAERGVVHHAAYMDEQAWSAPLPGWTWLVQFLVLGPINIIIVGQIGLLITSAVGQTSADGNAVLPLYLTIAGLSVLLLLPAAPFMHRIKWQLPTLLLLLSICTVLYCLLAFPFTRDARFRARFTQEVDLDHGTNKVFAAGVDDYIQQFVATLPSVADERVQCEPWGKASRGSKPLTMCSWAGIMPNVVPQGYNLSANRVADITDWIKLEVSRSTENSSTPAIHMRVQGANSRHCQISFDSPPRNVIINDDKHYMIKEDDWRYEDIRSETRLIKLFSRTFDAVFDVKASGFDDPAAISGHVMCTWSDLNRPGVVPAWDEMMDYRPIWANPSASSANVPIVGAKKRFLV